MARFTSGWVKLHRSIDESDLVDNPILLVLWIRLLLWARWKPGKIIKDGKQIEIPAGTVVCGTRELGVVIGCSSRTASRWLRYLEKTGRISCDSSRKGTIVYILNWSDYQGAGERDEEEKSARAARPVSLEVVQ